MEFVREKIKIILLFTFNENKHRTGLNVVINMDEFLEGTVSGALKS